jgi:hypothetical protein
MTVALVRVPAPRRRGALPKLPKPRGLQGVARRPIPIDGASRRFKKAIAETVHALERAIMAELRREGALGKLARAGEDYRERHGEKAPVGRSGRPLGSERARRVLPVFETEEFRSVGRLFKNDIDDWRLELETVLRDQYVRLYNIGGRGARLKLKVSGSFDLRNPLILDALEERANLISGISNSVYDRLRTVLAEEFYVFGNSPLEVAKVLEQEFTFLSRDRAELIARTETLAITSQAQHEVYEASGVEWERWITTLDGKERPDHFEAHGQIKSIDDVFVVGGEELRYVGDPEASLEQTANCRCDQIPIVTEDQILSDALVWRGDNDPDEFSKERIAAQEEEAIAAAKRLIDFLAEGAVKHLPGQHDQSEHGARGSEAEKPSLHRYPAHGRVRELERTIANSPVEKFFVVSKDGKIINQGSGSGGRVSFRTSDIGRYRGSISTHNHPGGRSFSAEDVIAGSMLDQAEIRVITPKKRIYRIQPKSGKWPTPEAIRAAFQAEDAKVTSRLLRDVEKGKITIEEANLEHHHRVWERIAPGLGLVYERVDEKSGEKHLGPGPHPSGTPQAVHGFGGESGKVLEKMGERLGKFEKAYSLSGDLNEVFKDENAKRYLGGFERVHKKFTNGWVKNSTDDVGLAGRVLAGVATTEEVDRFAKALGVKPEKAQEYVALRYLITQKALAQTRRPEEEQVFRGLRGAQAKEIADQLAAGAKTVKVSVRSISSFTSAEKTARLFANYAGSTVNPKSTNAVTLSIKVPRDRILAHWRVDEKLGGYGEDEVVVWDDDGTVEFRAEDIQVLAHEKRRLQKAVRLISIDEGENDNWLQTTVINATGRERLSDDEFAAEIAATPDDSDLEPEDFQKHEKSGCQLCGVSHRYGNKAGCPCPEPPGRPGPCACEGEGAAAGGTPSAAPRTYKDAVSRLHERARQLDPEVTAAFQRALQASGGMAEGLEFRIKQSLARAEDKLREKEQAPGEGASAPERYLHDMLRYTATFDANNYTSGRDRLVAAMERQGYSLLLDKNYWRGESYKGENLVFTHPSGFNFEMQIHTPDSYRIKEVVNHKLYEEARRPGTSRERFDELDARMRDNWRGIRIPPGAETRGNPAT